LVSQGDADFQLKSLFVSDTTSSSNSSTGSIFTLGGISINNSNNSTNCTNGGSFTSLGGAAIRKQLMVGDRIGLGSDTFAPGESLHIRQTQATVRLTNATNQFSYLDFQEQSNSLRYGIVNDAFNKLFAVTVSQTDQTPDQAQKILTFTSQGNLGIRTTSGINSPLTLDKNNFISTNTNEGYLGLIAGSSASANTSVGSHLMLFGNSSGNTPGDLHLHAGTSGSIQMFTNHGIPRVKIQSNGTVNIYSTTASKAKTSGSLVVSGGVSVASTENSESVNNGGALTVAGGMAIGKDIFIGGNLYITGNLNASGSSLTPEISFDNTQGCAVTSYGNTQLLTVSNQAILSFFVEVTPNAASQECSFAFQLPQRTNQFDNRGEFVGLCTGYTDDTNPVGLFNMLCIAVKNDSRGLIKFQSVSTNVHYFTVFCRYTLA
jgi:hypothetical protein